MECDYASATQSSPVVHCSGIVPCSSPLSNRTHGHQTFRHNFANIGRSFPNLSSSSDRPCQHKLPACRWRMQTWNLIGAGIVIWCHSQCSLYSSQPRAGEAPTTLGFPCWLYVGGWRCAASRIHYRNYFARKLCWFVVISSYICKLTVRFVMFVMCMMSVVHLIWVSCQDIEVDFAYEFVAIVATVVLEAVLVRCSLVPTGTFNQKHQNKQ